MLAFVLVIMPVGLHMTVHYIYYFCTCFLFCALIDAAGRDMQFFFPVFFVSVLYIIQHFQPDGCLQSPYVLGLGSSSVI